MPRVIKLKKVQEVQEVQEVQDVPQAPQIPEAPKKKVIKLKKAVPVPQASQGSEVREEVPEVPQVSQIQETPKKKVLKLKKNLLPIPPIPPQTADLSKTMEAFEAIREYYAALGQEPTQSDIAWYHAELEAEKKELDAFWSENKVVKLVLEAICRGATEEELIQIETAASVGVAPRPPTEADLGPMPAYGTGEFWAWCAKRKQIRLAKEAAIIAAGGTVPPPKVKKAKAKPKPQT